LEVQLEATLAIMSEGTTTGATQQDVKPPKPIMGDIVRLSKDEYAAWTGGAPNSIWTGLCTTANSKYKSWNPHHPWSPKEWLHQSLWA
jgi:hypothetical protein